VSVCVRESARARERERLMFECACVHACVQERERKRDSYLHGASSAGRSGILSQAFLDIPR
jgi:hypothetical protein